MVKSYKQFLGENIGHEDDYHQHLIDHGWETHEFGIYQHDQHGGRINLDFPEWYHEGEDDGYVASGETPKSLKKHLKKLDKSLLKEGKLPGSGKQTFSWKNKDRTKTGVMVVGRSEKSKRKPIKVLRRKINEADSLSPGWTHGVQSANRFTSREGGYGNGLGSLKDHIK